MTFYDGSTVRVTATVTDFDGNEVTSENAETAVVTILDTSGNYIVNNADLTWDSDESYWYYDWQSAIAGSWTALCLFAGSLFKVFNYATIRVKPLKIEPTGIRTSLTNDPNDPS